MVSDNGVVAQMLTYCRQGGYKESGFCFQEARAIIHGLKDSNWLDYNTRAVFLEFNIWNPNTNLFNMVTILVEFSTEGYRISSHSIETLQLYRYNGAGGVVALVAEIGCSIFIIIMAVMEIRKMMKRRTVYFRSVYNVTQLLIVMLFVVAFALYVCRSLWTIWTVEEFMNNRGIPPGVTIEVFSMV